MDERVELKNSIQAIVFGSNNMVNDMFNFVIEDRKRIVEPLVKYKNFVICPDSFRNWKEGAHKLSDIAIEKTLQNAEVQP